MPFNIGNKVLNDTKREIVLFYATRWSIICTKPISARIRTCYGGIGILQAESLNMAIKNLRMAATAFEQAATNGVSPAFGGRT